MYSTNQDIIRYALIHDIKNDKNNIIYILKQLDINC